MIKRLIVAAFALALLTAATPSRLTERQRAIHVLDRLGFGPRPGDVERLLQTGVDAYIQQQLDPERIDDSEVKAKLSELETLKKSDRELLAEFVEMRRQPRDQRKRLRVPLEMTAAKLIRATESDRQLEEVVVDFWMNHFNVFAGKGSDRVLIASFERDAIRPHVWGKFESLLMATAKSPAMLVYLDNARSIARPENRARAAARRRSQGGLNENYARELLELHTLGVDGGYTQKDVTELARLLTGWSVARPGEMHGGFVFRAALHDTKPKTVLGKHFPAGGGLAEGETMIRFLAGHPATAKHIATKLCQRLVADDPPPQLVNRVAKRFQETGGDLRATVRAIVSSPEFFNPAYYRAKVKTPFEYVVSAIRAVDATVRNPVSLARVLRDMGQPLYFAQPPTGYSDKAEDWVNTGAMVNRVNFAIALTSGKIPGVNARNGDLNWVELSETTRAAIKTADSPRAALLLGSPEFQKQ